LNPESDERDVFSEEQLQEADQQDCLEVNEYNVGSILERLPVGSAGGASGWTFGAIKAIFFEDNGQQSATNLLLAKFCNQMLAGKLDQDSGWLRCRAVLIPKKAGGWRPLSIGDAWYRFVGQVAMSVVGNSVGDKLSPIQLGCGVSSGCEIAGRCGQVILDSHEDVVLISLDLTNAYHKLARNIMLDGVLMHEPRLAKMCSWAYGQSSPLFLSDGQKVGENKTGCRQGDPLASLFFCAGIQDALLRIQTLIKQRVEDEEATDTPHGIIAFMDDILVFIKRSLANRIAGEIMGILTECRMEVNIDKCFFLTYSSIESIFSEENFNNDLDAFQVIEDGAIILGVPVGTPEFVRNTMAVKIKEATEIIPILQQFSPWVIWQLLKYCVNARMGYLSRVVEVQNSMAALADFDEVVDKVILKIAGMDSSLAGDTSAEGEDPCVADIKFLRSNPLARGGLGITRYAGLAGETACLLSRQVTYEYIEKYYPLLTVGTDEQFWDPISIGGQEEAFMEKLLVYSVIPEKVQSSLAMVLASGEESLNSEEGADVSKSYEERKAARRTRMATVKVGLDGDVRSTARTIQRRRAEDFIFNLDKRGEFARAAALRSQTFKGSGKWLDGPGGLFYGRFAFKNPQEYVTAFLQRLLLSPASKHVVGAESTVTCSCGKKIDPVKDPFHAFDCRAAQGFFVARHNAVRDSLAEFLGDYCHAGTGGRVLIEPQVFPVGAEEPQAFQTVRRRPNRPQSGQEIRQRNEIQAINRLWFADVGIDSPERQQYLDVVVVNAAAKSYRIADSTGPPEWMTRGDMECVREKHERMKTANVAGSSIAVIQRENDKLRHYQAILGDHVNTDSFIPFVVEATGRFSETASKFLDELIPANEEGGRRFLSKKSIFKSQIGAVIAVYNARAALAWARGVRAAQP
jgi:hypothetical protein